MGEVPRGHDDGDELRMERGWKMLMLLSRMLLARPRCGRISQRKLQTRINMFTTGQWHLLMDVSNECARVRRAETLVHLGELSAVRQALDGAEVAPGNLATLAQFTSPERRPGAQPQFLRGFGSWILSCSARMSVQHVVEPHRARLACQSNTSWDWSSPTTICKFSAVLPQSSAKDMCRGAKDWDG